uniref:Xylanolytic transcriptional activator regulatory domain-containing protein n=1 Tax=Bionectria ochroleuca TaxID=29856 RepID=A0A8H7TTE2_BIOOC
MRRDTTLPWEQFTLTYGFIASDAGTVESISSVAVGESHASAVARLGGNAIHSGVTTTASREEQLQLFQRIFSKLHANVSTDPESLRRFYMHLQTTTPECGGEQSTVSAGRTVENNSVQEHHQHHQHGSDGLCDGSSPNGTASVTVVSQGKTHYEGDSSLWCFFRSVRLAFADETSPHEDNDGEAVGVDPSLLNSKDTALRSISDIDSGVRRDNHSSHVEHRVRHRLENCRSSSAPPQDVVEFLTTTFFQLAQTNYFCVHPEIFSRKLKAFYEGTHEFESHNPLSSRRSIEFLSVLFMVLAIGSQFAEVGDVDSGQMSMSDDDFINREVLKGDLTSPYNLSRIKIPTPAQNPGWRFYEVSRRLLPDIVSSSSMASIQVCLLQGIYLPSTTSRDAGYNLLGLALRMAINMGLHRHFVSESIHPDIRELRNRLWWSIYVADRLYSIEMGRPLAINDAEINAPYPVDVSGWTDIHGRPRKVDGLVSLARICRILGKIVDTVYCKPASEKGATIRPHDLQLLKDELGDWKKSLPANIKLENFTTRYEAHLALTYEQSIILLSRSCLHCAVATCRPANSLEASATRFLRQQAQECVNAAVSSIRIMGALKDLSLLCRFSFHDSLYCSSALYVLIFASRKLEGSVSVPQSSIVQGIHILLELAKGSEAAALSLRGITQALASSPSPRNPNAGQTTNSGLRNTASSISGEHGRSAWKAWKRAMTDSQSHGRVSSTKNPMLWNEPMAGSRVPGFGLTPASDQPMQAEVSRYPYNPHHETNGDFNGGESMEPLPLQVDDDVDTMIDISNLAPFWVPEHPDFDNVGRGLGSALELDF